MPPYTSSTELYDALLARAGTLKDEAEADKLAAGLRAFSGLARTMVAGGGVGGGGVGGEGEGLTLVTAATVVGKAVKVPVLFTTLLPTPYSIIVPLLLLLSGLVLCFAGTFLTLDRTRRVPEHKKPGRDLFAMGLGEEEKKKGRRWRWESTGGVGGALGGWCAGGQLVTSLTLLILNKTTASTLAGVAFFVIWLVVSILFAVVGLRFRFAAFAFVALLGSHSLTLLLLQTFRLSTLLARLLPYPLFLLPLLLAFLTPYPAIQHHSLRLSTSFSGAFAVTLALSLLTKHDWAEGEVLQFVAGDAGLDWKSGSWKGFCAMGWLIALAGYGVDALLKGKLGENPDETWSSYLSDYASRGLPTSTPRQGTFTPHLSPWSRLLALNKPSHPHSPLSNEKEDNISNFTSLPKRRVATDASIVEEPLKLAKFRPSGDDSDSDDEDEKGDLGQFGGGMISALEEKERNWSFPSSNKATVKFSTSSDANSKYDPSTVTSSRPSFATQDSQRTLVGSDNTGYTKPRGPRRRESDGKVGSLIKRYDSISSLSSVQQSSPPDRKTSLASVDSMNSNFTPSRTAFVPDHSNWTPASRFTTSPPPTATALSPSHDASSPSSSFASSFQPSFPSSTPSAQPTHTHINARQLPLTPPENTPSLPQAYDRIARGQEEARLERMKSYQGRRKEEREREEEEERETKGEWEEFWEEVKRKSGGGEGR